MNIPYAMPSPPAPTECPCLTCGTYGPHCADACALFDAWELAGKPGQTTITSQIHAPNTTEAS